MGNKITEKLRQGGFTLMEMIAAMVVMGSVMVGVYSLSEQSLNNTKGSVVALHLRTVGDAANQYVKANTNTILTHLNANPTTPYLILVSDLISGGYLPTGYSATNSEGQTVCALVLKQGTNLNALVVAEGGNVLDDLGLGQIAATIGGAGGGIYSVATTTVKGAMGGWSFPIGNFTNANNRARKCDGSTGAVSVAVGHPAMALWLSEGSVDAATLYRDAVPGRASLNTMNTPIIMGSGTAVSRTEGSACNIGAADPIGAIARAPDGSVLSCVSGNTWQRPGSMYWRNAVASFASLPTTDPDGSVRVTRDTGRAFMWKAATSNWAALAVDQSGNMVIPNNLTVQNHLQVERDVDVVGDARVGGNVGVTGTIHSNGDIGSRSNIWADGDLRTYSRFYARQDATMGSNLYVMGTVAGWGNASFSGSVASGGNIGGASLSSSGAITGNGNISIGGDSDLRGRVRAREYVTIGGVVEVGVACSEYGTIARDSGGELLSCVGGVFKYVGGKRGIIGGGEAFFTEGSGAYSGCHFSWGTGVCTGAGFACSDGILTRAMTAYDNVAPSEASCRGGRCHVELYFCVK